MGRKFRKAMLAGAAVTLISPALHADVVLLSDSLTGTGSLAGTAPNIAGTGTWTTYYDDNGGELAPSVQTDTTGSGFTALTGGTVSTANLPVDGSRSSNGVNVGASNSHTDDGAYISLTTAPAGLITSTDTFTFPNIASSGNPTAWGFLALLTGAFSTSSNVPDVIGGTAYVGPWALVRPRSNGTDVVEIYATGGTGHQVTTTNVEAANVAAPHVIQLQYDPVAETLNATVDGTELLSTPYSYITSGVTAPTVDGVEFGNRTNTGQASNSAPSTTFFNGVSVTQAAVPEPTSLGLVSIGGLLWLRRRRPSVTR